MKEPSNFGRWLRDMRRCTNLTQEQLAKKSGVSSVQISHLETGHSQTPTTNTKNRLQQIFCHWKISPTQFSLLSKVFKSYNNSPQLKQLWDDILPHIVPTPPS